MSQSEYFQRIVSRSKKERRKKNALPPVRYLISGQRKVFRRQNDAGVAIFNDIFSTEIFVLVVFIMAMSAMDCFFTLIHLDNGATEMNPVMDIAIRNGERYFFITKYTLTSLGALLLCLYKNFFPVEKIIGSIFLLYFALTLYHIANLV